MHTKKKFMVIMLVVISTQLFVLRGHSQHLGQTVTIKQTYYTVEDIHYV